MKPAEEKLFILDLLKMNKSEKMYSEESVINIIKQVLKMGQPQKTEAEKEVSDDYGDCTFCGRSHSGKCKAS